jgi:uncharacterized repeat protein (TIGR03803 family)
MYEDRGPGLCLLTIVRNLTIVAVLAGCALAAPNASAYTLKTLYSFCDSSDCKEDRAPNAGLLRDAQGDLYGTTSWPIGAVFELYTHNGKWKVQVLHRFCQKANCTDGMQPVAPVITDQAGNLYGTTFQGGSGDGVVFKLSPNADKSKWSLKVIHAFCASCSDGQFPESGLTYAGHSSGALYDGVSPLYGATAGGGAGGGGILFELTPIPGKSRWKEKVIYTFCALANCVDGYQPRGELILDQAGTLYGVTAGGGSHDDGIVYGLSPRRKSWSETVLYSFCSQTNCADGIEPFGGVVMDAGGNLFGTTGGSDGFAYGTVFKLAPNGAQSQFTLLHTFCGNPDCGDGRNPWGELIMDGSGNFFGTTQYGGGHDIDGCDCGGGTVYRINGTDEQVLYSFCGQANCTDGEYPRAPLIEDGSGNLFGTTYSGGPTGGGTAFELTP